MFKRSIMILFLAVLLVVSSDSLARFTGPSISGRSRTVEEISDLRIGSYVTLSGHILEHQRSDYYTFQDATGQIRIEISSSVWPDGGIGPDTRVQILGEVDRSFSGRYIWVKSLSILP